MIIFDTARPIGQLADDRCTSFEFQRPKQGSIR